MKQKRELTIAGAVVSTFFVFILTLLVAHLLTGKANSSVFKSRFRDKPIITEFGAPIIEEVIAGGTTIYDVYGGVVQILVYAYDPDGIENIRYIEARYNDLPMGVYLYDDGEHNDRGPSDGYFGNELVVPANSLPIGTYLVDLVPVDYDGNSGKAFTISFNIIPAQQFINKPLITHWYFSHNCRQRVVAKSADDPIFHLLVNVYHPLGLQAIKSVDLMEYHGASTTFFLYDDGLHGDGNAGDGIYGLILPLSEIVIKSCGISLWNVKANDYYNNISNQWPIVLNPSNTNLTLLDLK